MKCSKNEMVNGFDWFWLLQRMIFPFSFQFFYFFHLKNVMSCWEYHLYLILAYVTTLGFSTLNSVELWWSDYWIEITFPPKLELHDWYCSVAMVLHNKINWKLKFLLHARTQKKYREKNPQNSKCILNALNIQN